MIKESYISMWNKLPKDVIKVRVARPSVLSASEGLLHDYKNGRITWGNLKQDSEKKYRTIQKQWLN